MKRREVNKALGSNLAQNDKNFLKYCVERNDILDDLKCGDDSFLLLNAVRGSGKSGLLLQLNKQLTCNGEITSNVVIMKYYNDVVRPNSDEDVDQYSAFGKHTMLSWVLTQIGTTKKLALSEDSIRSVESAEKEGEKQLSFIYSIMNRLKIKGLPEKIEYDSTVKIGEVKRLVEKEKKSYWLLLDEMDDNYTNTESKNNCLLGLLSAASYITQKIDNLYVRITIRPHILKILETYSDKAQIYHDIELNVSWTSTQLREILYRRFKFYDDKNAFDQGDLFKLSDDLPNDHDAQCKQVSRFIQDFDMSFKKNKTSSYRVFHTLSIGRPRWMIEFCKRALSQSSGSYASIRQLKKAMHYYGVDRVQFAIGEHNCQWEHIAFYISQISSLRLSQLGSSSELKELIIAFILKKKESLHGDVSNDVASLEIAKCLYITEIIRAKERVKGQDNHRFYTFVDQPTLLESWDVFDGVTWEIHPTYALGMNITNHGTYRVGDMIKLFEEKRKREKKGSNSLRDALSSFDL